VGGDNSTMKLLLENWREYLTEDVAIAQQYPILFSLSHGNKARALQIANDKGFNLPEKVAARAMKLTNRPVYQKMIADGEYQKQNEKHAQLGYWKSFAHGPDAGVTSDLKDPETKEKNDDKLNLAAAIYVWALERGLNPTNPYLKYVEKDELTYIVVDFK